MLFEEAEVSAALFDLACMFQARQMNKGVASPCGYRIECRFLPIKKKKKNVNDNFCLRETKKNMPIGACPGIS